MSRQPPGRRAGRRRQSRGHDDTSLAEVHCCKWDLSWWTGAWPERDQVGAGVSEMGKRNKFVTGHESLVRIPLHLCIIRPFMNAGERFWFMEKLISGTAPVRSPSSICVIVGGSGV